MSKVVEHIVMKKDTIVFLNIYPLGKVFGDSLGMKQFEQAGYNLIYLNMSKMYYPKTYTKFNALNKEYIIEKGFFIECETREEVLNIIRKYSKRAWFFVLYMEVYLQLDQLWLNRAFRKSKCNYFIAEFFPIYMPMHLEVQTHHKSRKLYFITAFLKHLSSFKLRIIMEKSVGWFAMFLLGRNIFFRKPDYCFVAGKVSYNYFMKVYPKSKIINVPSFDYFKYHCVASSSKEEKSSEIPSYGYVLYYDQAIFDTPDGRLLGRHQYISKDKFLEKINRFFERIENVTGKKVVIAGSPKIRYEGHEFNNREILYNLTAELTYYAEMIIMHTTSAFNYAVAMNKPIIISKIKGLNEFSLRNLYTLASYLNKKVIDVDEDFGFQKLKEYSKINHKIYKDHVCNYMANGPFTVSPIEVVIETLNNCEGS